MVKNKNAGFTITEITFVVMILGIVFIATLTFVRGIYNQQNFNRSLQIALAEVNDNFNNLAQGRIPEAYNLECKYDTTNNEIKFEDAPGYETGDGQCDVVGFAMIFGEVDSSGLIDQEAISTYQTYWLVTTSKKNDLASFSFENLAQKGDCSDPQTDSNCGLLKIVPNQKTLTKGFTSQQKTDYLPGSLSSQKAGVTTPKWYVTWGTNKANLVDKGLMGLAVILDTSLEKSLISGGQKIFDSGSSAYTVHQIWWRKGSISTPIAKDNIESPPATSDVFDRDSAAAVNEQGCPRWLRQL